MAFLEIENLTCGYGSGANRIEVLKGINLRADSKGVIALLGASGSGKSTLLYCLAGYLSYEGRINIKNNVTPAFVFQDSHLLDFLTLSENVALPLIFNRTPYRQRKAKSIVALKSLGLVEVNKRPDRLSGGEKERVGIARALVTDSQLLLMDEPTGSLDSDNSRKIEDIILRLKKDRLIVVATHDRELAERCADQIVELSNGRLLKSKEAIVGQMKKDAKVNQCEPTRFDAFILTSKMLSHRWRKTLLGSIISAVALTFVILLGLLFLNARETLSELSRDYFGRTLTSISEVSRIAIDDNFGLIRSVRPDSTELENYGVTVWPSLAGVIPGSYSVIKNHKKVDVVLAPAVCETGKLESGRCPESYEEVVVNRSLLKLLETDSAGFVSHSVEFATNGGQKTVTDKTKIDLDLTTVGVSKETEAFNVPTAYYDYSSMKKFLSGLILKNTSKLFNKDVSVYERLSSMAAADEAVGGYAFLIYDLYPERLKQLFSSAYELTNRALEMEKATFELMSSLTLIGEVFLSTSLLAAATLLFVSVLTIYEQEKPTLALYKSFGLSNRGFKMLAAGGSWYLALLNSGLTALAVLFCQRFLTAMLKPLQLAGFVRITDWLFLLAVIATVNGLGSLLIGRISSRKVLKSDLIMSLRGE